MELFYYKRGDGSWLFSIPIKKNQQHFKDEAEAVRYLIQKRKEGFYANALYLDNPGDFEKIKELFFTPEYWANRTWQQEYEQE